MLLKLDLHQDNAAIREPSELHLQTSEWFKDIQMSYLGGKTSDCGVEGFWLDRFHEASFDRLLSVSVLAALNPYRNASAIWTVFLLRSQVAQVAVRSANVEVIEFLVFKDGTCAFSNIGSVLN